MIIRRNYDTELSVAIVEGGVLISAAVVTVDVYDIKTGSLILSNQEMTEIVGGSNIYRRTVSAGTFTKQYYQAVYKYDNVVKLSEQITVIDDQRREASLIGIIENTDTMVGVVET